MRVSANVAHFSIFTADSMIVGRLALSNMFNILNPLESVDGSRPTIGVGRREIAPVGTGLYQTYILDVCCPILLADSYHQVIPLSQVGVGLTTVKTIQ